MPIMLIVLEIFHSVGLRYEQFNLRMKWETWLIMFKYKYCNYLLPIMGYGLCQLFLDLFTYGRMLKGINLMF